MLSVDVEELFAYHLVVENGRLTLSPEKAYEIGYERGYERGYKQGLELGRREVILKALKKMSPELVAELRDVPLEKVKAIQGEDKS